MDDYFGLSGGLQPLPEGGEVRAVSGDDAGDDEEDAAGSCTAAVDRAAAASLAAVVGEGAEADELADGVLGKAADLGHFGQQAGDGALGDALDLVERPIEAGPEGIVVDEPGDPAFEVAALGVEQPNDLLEAFDRLGVGGGALAPAIGDEVVPSPG